MSFEKLKEKEMFVLSEELIVCSDECVEEVCKLRDYDIEEFKKNSIRIIPSEDVLAFLEEQEDDRRTARKCLLYRGVPDCSNKDCINFVCPLNKNKKRGEKNDRNQ